MNEKQKLLLEKMKQDQINGRKIRREQRAIKLLICMLDDEDMRDNIKGYKLIQYVREHFTITPRSNWAIKKTFNF